MIQLGAKAWHSKRKWIMNSYILKNQEPLSNRWGIEVVTFGNNMTFLGSSRTYGLLSMLSCLNFGLANPTVGDGTSGTGRLGKAISDSPTIFLDFSWSWSNFWHIWQPHGWWNTKSMTLISFHSFSLILLELAPWSHWPREPCSTTCHFLHQGQAQTAFSNEFKVNPTQILTKQTPHSCYKAKDRVKPSQKLAPYSCYKAKAKAKATQKLAPYSCHKAIAKVKPTKKLIHYSCYKVKR